MDLWFTQRTDYTVNKGDRLTYQYFNTNVGFAKSSTKVSRKEFLFDRQSTFDCRFAETLKRIDINKPREDSFFLPSPRSQCRKLKAYANLQKKLSQVLRQWCCVHLLVICNSNILWCIQCFDNYFTRYIIQTYFIILLPSRTFSFSPKQPLLLRAFVDILLLLI